MDTKSQNSNMLLAFLTLTGVIAIVAVVGFAKDRKSYKVKLKSQSIGYRAKYRDEFWNSA